MEPVPSTPARVEALRALAVVGGLVPYLVVVEIYRRAGFGAERLAALGIAVAVALPAHLALQALGAAAAGLRPATVEVGVGRQIADAATPAGQVIIRRLPLRLAFDSWPTSPRGIQVRLWVPHALAFSLYLGTLAACWFRARLTGEGPAEQPAGWLAAGAVSVAGLLSIVCAFPLDRAVPRSGSRLLGLLVTDATALVGRCAPFVDGRVRRANVRFRLAAGREEVEAARSAVAELEAIPAAAPLLPAYRATVLLMAGEFADAARVAREYLGNGAVMPTTARFAVVDGVFSAIEADQPVDAGLIADARAIVAGAQDMDPPLRAWIVARLALYDNDVDGAISWGERALRLSRSADLDASVLLTLAQAYARRGWRREVGRTLSRVRRLSPRSPRLSHVERRVAEALAGHAGGATV